MSVVVLKKISGIQDLEVGKLYTISRPEFLTRRIRPVEDPNDNGTLGTLKNDDDIVLLAVRRELDTETNHSRCLVKILQNSTGVVGWINFWYSEWRRWTKGGKP